MNRHTWWVAFAVVGLTGCTETDPDKINNNLPSTPTVAPTKIEGSVAGPTGGAGGQTTMPPSYPGMEKMKPQQAKADSSKDTVKPETAKTDTDKANASSVTLSDEEIKGINELPDPADRAAALAQKLCPVGSEAGEGEGHLGAMGPPIKKEVNGKTVFLCCKSCIKEIEKDPDKYLAKLKN